MHTLKNDLIQIKIKSIGAELCSISSVKNDKEFLWQANSNIWGSHAPNLFPIIGAMKDDCYIYENKSYPMTKHGFVRKNDDFSIKNISETSITFLLVPNEALNKMYPFLFEFEINYTVKDNAIIINFTIKNKDKKTIYFSVGGHPAFNCPLHENENYTDYILKFEKAENSKSHILNMNNGLVSNQTKHVFTDGNSIQLRKDLFNEDALIFKDLKSRTVSLQHKTKGEVLSVTFKDFPFLGIWAKPKAPYVCIEPWIGIADSETTNQKIENKEGIVALDAGLTFKASYSIEIDKSHLA